MKVTEGEMCLPILAVTWVHQIIPVPVNAIKSGVVFGAHNVRYRIGTALNRTKFPFQLR